MVWHQAAVRAEHINKSGDRKMFCKYCGSRTDSNNSVCERCMQPVNSENGNGFWDMAADPRAYSQTNKQVIEKVVVKEVKKPMLLPIVISTVICVFCLILLALNVATSKKTTKEIVSTYEAQLNKQRIEYEETIGLLKSKVALAEEKASNLENADKCIEIIQTPSFEMKPLGFVNPVGTWLFELRVADVPISFQWEKQQKNGTWLPITFSGTGTETKYGFRLDENTKQGFSRLAANGLTKNSEGNYKCTVITEQGTVSLEVTLTINETELTSGVSLNADGGNQSVDGTGSDNNTGLS